MLVVATEGLPAGDHPPGTEPGHRPAWAAVAVAETRTRLLGWTELALNDVTPHVGRQPQPHRRIYAGRVRVGDLLALAGAHVHRINHRDFLLNPAPKVAHVGGS